MDTRLMDELQSQLQGMRKLLVSEEWILWANFLKKDRRGHLQNKINSAVEAGNLVEAQIALALFKDCVKQIDLFSRHIQETEAKTKPKGV